VDTGVNRRVSQPPDDDPISPGARWSHVRRSDVRRRRCRDRRRGGGRGPRDRAVTPL